MLLKILMILFTLHNPDGYINIIVVIKFLKITYMCKIKIKEKKSLTEEFFYFNLLVYKFCM